MADKKYMNFMETVRSEHSRFWFEKREALKQYRNAYLTKWWKNKQLPSEMVRVEVAEGYATVESYIASLFTKNPGVEIDCDEVTPEQKSALRHVLNRWLVSQRTTIENLSRLALIYPQAFVKLYVDEKVENPLERVKAKTIEPWSIILDTLADSWEEQRYCGHVYWLTYTDAVKRFGLSQSWTPRPIVEYWDKKSPLDDDSIDGQDDLPQEFLFVEITELYDLVNDKIIFYSSDLKGGPKIIETIDRIQPRTHNDQPLPPIAPLYFASEPDRPLIGYSTLARVYDQISEVNVLRTWWANSVRRDSRQFMFDKTRLDEDNLAKLTAGVDGALVGIDGPVSDDIIRPLRVESITSNHDRYLNYIDNDLRRGTMLAAFTQGVAQNVSATEIQALAQYTASELGRMARSRDGAIEAMAVLFLRMVRAEIDKPIVVSDGGDIHVLDVDVFEKKIIVGALDSAQTPISKALKQDRMLMLAPQLLQLGTKPQHVLEEMVRLFDLPEQFAEVEQQDETGSMGVIPPGRAEAAVGNEGGDPNILAAENIAGGLPPGAPAGPPTVELE